MALKELQNGSDVRGIAMEGIEGQHVNLTKDAVVRIARGFARWLKQKTGKDQICTAVGRDSRLTGPDVVKWTIDGLAAEGASVLNFGLASTPAMFMSTVLDGWKLDGTVMITASHMPFNRNGMKFFGPQGGLEKQDIAAIIADAETLSADVPEAKAEAKEFMDDYCGYLRDKVKAGVNAADYDHPLKGYHVVVDAGNGAGGFFAERVLVPLGADISGSRYLDPDGSFPNHIPNPEDEAAMASITEAVLESKADLGLIFDTDVDRGGAVLKSGEELNRNRLIAMISAILLRDYPGSTMVTDSVTSTGLKTFIESRGGKHHRFKRGYRNVINESIRLNNDGIDSQLAMETSGHGALKENYFLDDGSYLCVKLLIELGRGNVLEDLVADLKEPAESKEVRLKFFVEDFRPVGEKVLELVKAAAEKTPGWSLELPNYEGVRVNADADHGNGWFLLRMSLHEPLMPLNIESEIPGGCTVIARTLKEILKDCEGLDLAPLEKLL